MLLQAVAASNQPAQPHDVLLRAPPKRFGRRKIFLDGASSIGRCNRRKLSLGIDGYSPSRYLLLLLLLLTVRHFLVDWGLWRGAHDHFPCKSIPPWRSLDADSGRIEFSLHFFEVPANLRIVMTISAKPCAAACLQPPGGECWLAWPRA